MTLVPPYVTPCPFCEYLAGAAPCAFVNRGALVSSFLNRTQYERGALLVVPNVHAESVLDAGDRLVSEVHREARRLAHTLVGQFGATGVNIFQNNGTSAGQSVPHYHVHVVPRYSSSDPARRFREADFDVTPHADLEMLARQLADESETGDEHDG